MKFPRLICAAAPLYTPLDTSTLEQTRITRAVFYISHPKLCLTDLCMGCKQLASIEQRLSEVPGVVEATIEKKVSAATDALFQRINRVTATHGRVAAAASLQLKEHFLAQVSAFKALKQYTRMLGQNCKLRRGI